MYCIVEDLLRAVGHQEDCRMKMSDAEVITSELEAARFYGANQTLACKYLQEHGLIPDMLSKSRFSRRLHRLFLPMLEMIIKTRVCRQLS